MLTSTSATGGQDEGSTGDPDETPDPAGIDLPREDSTGADEPPEPEPSAHACEALSAAWGGADASQLEIDFDGSAETPAVAFSCAEPEPGHAVLTLLGDGYDLDLGILVGEVELGALTLEVPATSVVGATSTQWPALTTGGLSAEVEVTIRNAGRIQGAGGTGGHGGVCTVPSTPGEHGGVALEIFVPVRLTQVFESDGAEQIGRLWGGGGGGGGGGDGCDEGYCGGTGAGGGGAGSMPGRGGTATDPASLPSLNGTGTCADYGGHNSVGGDATWDAGGPGGGGPGGGPGEPGPSGHPGEPDGTTTAQPGGSAGCAFVAHAAELTFDGGDIRPGIQQGCFGAEPE